MFFLMGAVLSTGGVAELKRKAMCADSVFCNLCSGQLAAASRLMIYLIASGLKGEVVLPFV